MDLGRRRSPCRGGGLLGLAVVALLGCHRSSKSDDAGRRGDSATGASTAAPGGNELLEARRRLKTHLLRKEVEDEPIPSPPSALFRLVKYQSAVGPLGAWLSVAPADGKKRPAILWLIGGFGSSLSGEPWANATTENDQTGSAFRKAGLLMMYPSYRGGSGNPGYKEGFLGEVDDILAAGDFLARQPEVDPERVYLGGHSTGGTLALLAAESGGRFRAVIAFGPVGDPAGYGPDELPYDVDDRHESTVRAPLNWLRGIRTPTFVMEGDLRPGNLSALRQMSRVSTNPLVHFLPIHGATHFTQLAPVTALVAKKLLADTGRETNLDFTEGELAALFAR
jgi:acetyl esterase/lipase